MNVIVFASRKGGSGKSTLAANLAAQASATSRLLLIDTDPQRSLSLWQSVRQTGGLELRNAEENVAGAVAAAEREGFEWVFIDTPANVAATVAEAIRCATLVVVPARIAFFDLIATKQTLDLSYQLGRPYAVVINGAPARWDINESPGLREVRELFFRLKVPAWSGQISQRAQHPLALAEGAGITEYAPQSEGAQEIASLWLAIEKSVEAINGAYSDATMHLNAA